MKNVCCKTQYICSNMCMLSIVGKMLWSCNNIGRNVNGGTSACNSLMNTISLCPSDKPTVYIPLVYVRINNVCNIVALLDTASTNFFVSKYMYKRLHLEGDQCKYSY